MAKQQTYNYDNIRKRIKKELSSEPEYNLWEYACDLVDDIPNNKLEYYLKQFGININTYKIRQKTNNNPKRPPRKYPQSEDN